MCGVCAVYKRLTHFIYLIPVHDFVVGSRAYNVVSFMGIFELFSDEMLSTTFILSIFQFPMTVLRLRASQFILAAAASAARERDAFELECKNKVLRHIKRIYFYNSVK